MRKDLLAIGLGMVLSGVTVFSSLAAGGTVTLHGHVPVAVSYLQTSSSGRLDSEKMMQISIGLPLRNEAALSNLLQQISDPASPNYRHYLTPAQFTDAFGATEKDYQAVIDFAVSHHLTVTQKHPNRLVLSVRGKAADVEKAFNVTLRTYQHPKESRTFFAPDTEPSVDAGLKILHISGLDNYSIPHPNLHRMDSTQSKNVPMIGSGPGGAYQGSDFRKAYVPNTALTGAGQNVGLVQFDGFFASDIAAYETQIGLTGTLPNIVVVPIDGGVPVPTPVGNPEVSLDIEMILSMAPQVSNIYVYEAPNPSPWVDILSRMVNDNSAKQLSSSWGNSSGADPIVEQLFQQMAVQGQSFFQASGDSDAYTGAIPFPSDSPHITVVGGTTLTTTRNANYTSETVWNWGISLGLDGEGSSGGVSTFYPIPSWQTNINMVARGGSATMRNLPDVSLTADNVQVSYGAGQAGAFGGTSCAAPLWAAFMALANQQAALNSQPPLGFVNPALYSIAQSGNYNVAFHDVTTGNNEWSGSPNLFSALGGYDLATGLGTPNGTNLINALLASNKPAVHISPPPPPYGSTMATLNGGNPNGPWMLFVQDDAPISSGLIANGWVLNLTTADLVGTAGDIETLVTTPSTNAFVGQTATFVVTVTNYGPSLSTNVTVVDTMPLGTVILSTNATQGTIARLGATLNWNVGNLAVNAGAAMTVTVKSQTVGTVANSSTVSTGTPDPNPDDDSSFATVNFVPLSVKMTPLFANGNFTISIPGPTNPSLTVIIQANSNLVSTNWVNVFTGQPPINFVDPAPSGNVSRFYRAILLP